MGILKKDAAPTSASLDDMKTSTSGQTAGGAENPEPKGSDVSNPNAPTASPTPHIEGKPQGPSMTPSPDERTGTIDNPDVVRIEGDLTGITGASADVKKGPNVLEEEGVRHEREALSKDALANPDQKATYRVLSGSVKHAEGQYAAQGTTVELTGAQAAGLLSAGIIEKALALPHR